MLDHESEQTKTYFRLTLLHEVKHKYQYEGICSASYAYIHIFEDVSKNNVMVYVLKMICLVLSQTEKYDEYTE